MRRLTSPTRQPLSFAHACFVLRDTGLAPREALSRIASEREPVPNAGREGVRRAFAADKP